ncbi:MAG: NlpC/P60 family protein [Nanoarchaeota archaeon]
MYHIPSNKFKIYAKGQISKYIGRKFNWQNGGCLSVVKDYLYDKTNIKIKDYIVGEDSNNNKILDNYKNEGFIKVEDFQENDILIFNIRERYHIAIYLGNSLILHQPRNRDSLVNDLSNYERYLFYILRHKSLF